MTRALRILRGRFGCVALLDVDTSLVDHAHPHYHLIFKVGGPDQNFVVEGRPVPLRSDTLVAAFRDVTQYEGALADFVRRSLFGVWHPSGGCRMGDRSHSAAVVDPFGQVIGSENIYVADASVMPRLPTANTDYHGCRKA